MILKIPDPDLAKIAIGIIEWRLEEGAEQDGRYGATQTQITDYFSHQDISLTDEEEEELYEKVHDVIDIIMAAVKKTLKEFDQTGDSNNAE